MSVAFYHVLHLVGVMCLMLGLGGILAVGKDHADANRFVSILHGVGLVIVLVSGFGIAGKAGLGFPTWMIVKLVLWIVMGALLVVGKRGVLPAKATVLVALVLGGVLAWLGYTKPF